MKSGNRKSRVPTALGGTRRDTQVSPWYQCSLGYHWRGPGKRKMANAVGLSGLFLA